MREPRNYASLRRRPTLSPQPSAASTWVIFSALLLAADLLGLLHPAARSPASVTADHARLDVNELLDKSDIGLVPCTCRR
ncbi:MAG: hypothetical protein U5N55_09920 [Cypionkella sp.]|nr:hypothetical protein [Cypionkella sp.]